MRLRLLKMIVQPVYVLDDGESLIERQGEPFALSSGDIPSFPERWGERFAAIRDQVEGYDPTADPRRENDASRT